MGSWFFIITTLFLKWFCETVTKATPATSAICITDQWVTPMGYTHIRQVELDKNAKEPRTILTLYF